VNPQPKDAPRRDDRDLHNEVIPIAHCPELL